jgi:hypothetical protein
MQYSQKTKFLTVDLKSTCHQSKFLSLIRILPIKDYDFDHLEVLFRYITHQYHYYTIYFHLEVKNNELLATIHDTKHIEHLLKVAVLD